ncbi:MAG: sulfite exporter TauE/SafE family protein [Nitrospirae bacterium]|nr:sulfite exporter TauE/SafE family protein [Nitrospirota bacterium]NTW65311.1 sulfite exporter TauE/SafE family protein [Nitrospirota bacterium]
MSILDLIAVGLAAVAGGFVNAIAGGGTLITFPMLIAVGIPPVIANVTNTVALCPGYVGGTYAQRRDLQGQKKRMGMLLPTGILGGITGGILLLSTSDATFRNLIPYLILTAVILLAFQDQMRNAVMARMSGSDSTHPYEAWAIPPIFFAAIYGGYFGAGLGVMMLAVLGLVLDDSLTRLNALKQSLSFAINIAAALFFLFSGKVFWTAAAVMAVGALAGGVLGGRVASRIQPIVLRWIVIVIGVSVAIVYFVR